MRTFAIPVVQAHIGETRYKTTPRLVSIPDHFEYTFGQVLLLIGL